MEEGILVTECELCKFHFPNDYFLDGVCKFCVERLIKEAKEKAMKEGKKDGH